MDFFNEGVFQILRQRAVQRRIGKFFSHPVVLLAIATVFATLAGAWLTNYYQKQAWLREKEFEIRSYGLDEGLKVVDELSESMSRRLFGLNRVVWVAKGTGTGELDHVWQEYYESVVDSNVTLARYKSRLRRFVGEEAAQAFASPADAALSDSEGTPASIHGQFMVAHQKVRALVDCVRDRCQDPARQAALTDAQQELNTLGESVDAFLDSCLQQL